MATTRETLWNNTVVRFSGLTRHTHAAAALSLRGNVLEMTASAEDAVLKPACVKPEHMKALREAGLDDTEIVDLILSSALLGWANRLMHVLGDPVRSSAKT